MQPVTIVIPAYNEGNGIGPTLQKVRHVLNSAGMAWEIIVVDDGSMDNTAVVVEQYDFVRLLRHPHNKGYGASLKTGIRQASHEVVVIIDADGTYPCEMVPMLVEEMASYDMVVGARTGETVQVPLVRRPAKWLLNRLANYLSGMAIPDLNSGLRAFKRDVVMQYFRQLPSGFSFTTSITLAMLTNDYNVLYVPIDYFKRTGKSKIRPFRDTINFFSLVIRVILSYRPLRVFVPLAILLSFVSLSKVAYDINAYDFHIATSTVVMLTLTFQIIVLGLIADLVVSLHKS
ncbi:MAG: glycosyltransferase family 2 protein [Ardenticatenaceae bacterium]|nr:glycosyltransferase family 2 protein [Anaerolineales bacterium]MCB8921413.1 glycosyltransferase family 2 protein [Ardenticatenaceae bacterium]MCB8991530.1 glycosyltransferase family 2 protein [Ardenticatenaceae bacterium]MCB9005109.1 glycosyltransferase family 2 protein [Ardenticatenaceae bacterium]